MSPARVPLSVHDLGTVGAGQTSGDALRGSIEIARAADAAGYLRFWVAEHHNAPSVASSSPAVLAAAIAARTEGIRLGSGGVMLPNHMPFAIAEQFALLEALHPGRIDLAVGRAPGTDGGTAQALRGGRADAAADFPSDLQTLMGLLGRPGAPRIEHLRATPAATTSPDVWVLGSSEFGASLAAALGLPFAFAQHDPRPDAGARPIELYRQRFRPSEALAEPYAMITASVVAAATEEEARFLAGPSRIEALSLRRGSMHPVVSPEEAASMRISDEDRAFLAVMPGIHHVGDAAQVAERLEQVVASTGADELILGGAMHDPTTRAESLRLVASEWGLAPRGSSVLAA